MYQRVTLSRTKSNWRRINADFPQGSMLGPLLLLVYVNDLTDNISFPMYLFQFAEDSFLFTHVDGSSKLKKH